MNWYFLVLKKHFDFTGRARRTEYWMFSFINFLISLLVLIFDYIQAEYTGVFGLFDLPYSLVVFIPSLAVSVRRLHDTGHSGWWTLVNLIPIIGGLWFLILMLKDGTVKTNDWGRNPKQINMIEA